MTTEEQLKMLADSIVQLVEKDAGLERRIDELEQYVGSVEWRPRG
jgi:hypothetical protein